jgi:hypothetical protein
MLLTLEHLDIAFTAWAAAQDGGGVALAPELVPAAHELAEAGWLQRRFVTDSEMSWWWTPAADTALGFSSLLNSHEGRHN